MSYLPFVPWLTARSEVLYQVLPRHWSCIAWCWSIRCHYYQPAASAVAAATAAVTPSCYPACMTPGRLRSIQPAIQLFWPLQALTAPHIANATAISSLMSSLASVAADQVR